MARAIISSIAKVNRSCAAEPATRSIRRLDCRGHCTQGGADISTRSNLENVHLPLITCSPRGVAQSHVVRESMHRTAMERGKSRSKDEGISTRILLEEKQL